MTNIESENKINDKGNNWLALYRKNITSQSGEDGIIEKIFELIKGDNWCVEFGACDGKSTSNTWNLINNKGWSAVPIEPNKKKIKNLLPHEIYPYYRHSNHNQRHCIHYCNCLYNCPACCTINIGIWLIAIACIPCPCPVYDP